MNENRNVSSSTVMAKTFQLVVSSADNTQIHGCFAGLRDCCRET